MNLDKFTGSGSTPSRRRFWDKVTDAVLSSQKLEGRNVSVQERQGQGTVINFTDQTPSSSGGCPPISVDVITVTFSSVDAISCGCVDFTFRNGYPSSQFNDIANINLSYDLTNFGPFPPVLYGWIGCNDLALIDWELDNTTTDCEALDPQSPTEMCPLAWCDETGFNLMMTDGAQILFLATGITGSLASIPNTLSCGDGVIDPFGTLLVATGTGGIASVSF